jgi:Flp pilus assembly protein TadB
MPEKPDMTILAALAEHTAALNRNTAASDRSAEAANQLSIKVDRLSTELHELRGRVETIEDAADIEQKVQERLKAKEQQMKTPEFRQDQSWSDVIKKNPVAFVSLALGISLIAALVLTFAMARDPFTAGRVVDKVPTREIPK